MNDVLKGLFDPNEVATAGDQAYASVEIFGKIMEETFSKTDIELKTELNDTQIVVYTQAEAFADKYDLPILNKIINGIMYKSVSRGRKGRKEFADVAKASFGSIYGGEISESNSVRDRLLGR